MSKETIDYDNMYPRDPRYNYSTEMERLNLDDEKIRDFASGKGFIISEYKNVNKSLKDQHSIFSSKYGQTLQDMNPFEDRYKCNCGDMVGRIYHDLMCPKCKTRVKFVDDDFEYFGWVELNPEYSIIHPNLYKSMQALIGESRLDNIIKIWGKKDRDGFKSKIPVPKKDEIFFGIGMMDFKVRCQEVLDYYVKKFPLKKQFYDDLMEERDKIWINSIPVFTTQMRPYHMEENTFSYGKTNEKYAMISKLAHSINRSGMKIMVRGKPKNKLLYDIQCEYNDLYKEMDEILSGKKGIVRSLFGGRYNFTARNVIVPDIRLEVDQITLSYYALVELLQQSIVNILTKSYHMSYNEAYYRWYMATLDIDPQVKEIINGIIANHNGGIPVIINRNPSIALGSILQMFVVGINDNYTMGLPLQILKIMQGDFDGDCLNIMYIINQRFFRNANRVWNPRNAMFISRNDGLMNNDLNHSRDTIINLQTFIRTGRTMYSQEELDAIQTLKNR